LSPIVASLIHNRHDLLHITAQINFKVTVTALLKIIMNIIHFRKSNHTSSSDGFGLGLEPAEMYTTRGGIPSVLLLIDKLLMFFQPPGNLIFIQFAIFETFSVRASASRLSCPI